MKKTLVSCLAAGAMMSASSAFAVGAGTIIVSGGTKGGYSSDTMKADTTGAKDVKTSKMNLNAGVGYFVIPNLAVGLGLDYSSESEDDGNTSVKKDTSNTSIGPFAMYMMELNPQMHAYGKFAYMMASGSTKSTPVDPSDNKTSGSIIEIGGGVAYMLAKNVAADVGLSYNIISGDTTPEGGSKVKGSGSALMIGVGLQIFFGK